MTALPPPAAFPAGRDPTAVMGRRIVAYLIDAVIAWVVMAAVFWSVSDTIPNTAFVSCGSDGAPTLCLEYGDTIRFAEGGDANLVTVSGLVVWALLGMVIQGLTGGTPGKLMVGLRVVDRDDGRHAGFGRCVARTAMWLVDAFPYIFPLVGLITGVVSKGHRRVGDMAAGTLVVRADAVGTPPVVPGLTIAGAPGWPSPASTGVQGGWMPPTEPPTQAPPPADLADPFARPAGQVFPTPGQLPPTDAPPVATTPSAATPPPPPPPDDSPRWDPARNAYVWFDRARDQWLVHDTATDQWRPL